MRIALPLVFLLFGMSSAHSQTPTQSQTPTATPTAEQAVTVQPQVQPPTAAVPAPAVPEESVRPQTPARAEAATATHESKADEPRQRSRVLWILVGAVFVLGILVAVSQ